VVGGFSDEVEKGADLAEAVLFGGSLLGLDDLGQEGKDFFGGDGLCLSRTELLGEPFEGELIGLDGFFPPNWTGGRIDTD